jgi:hypothetical protein
MIMMVLVLLLAVIIMMVGGVIGIFTMAAVVMIIGVFAGQLQWPITVRSIEELKVY